MKNPYEILKESEIIKAVKVVLAEMEIPLLDKVPSNLVEIPSSYNEITDDVLSDIFTQQTEILRYISVKLGEADSILMVKENEYELELNKSVLKQEKERRKELDEARAFDNSDLLKLLSGEIQVLKAYYRILSGVYKGQEKLVERISREQSRRERMFDPQRRSAGI